MLNSVQINSIMEYQDRMPILFIGHGSPMMAIEKSIYSNGIETFGKKLPKPKAVLFISAHWETRGTFVTAMENPKTIHDFGGFPKKLYEEQYPAIGDIELAKEVQNIIHSTEVSLNYDWGLDHGCWAVMKYLFPKVDVPIVELSIDYTKPASFHYALAKELSTLRKKGIMIIASGNVIHNLRIIDWENINTPYSGYDWAIKVHERIVGMIKNGDHQSLVNYNHLGREFQLAAPTPDHFIPLLYILALQQENDNLTIFNDSIVGGSLDMTSVMFA